MNKLHRFAPDGRYLGFIVQDRPIEAYADRLGVDLTEDQPPAVPIGYCAYRLAGTWVLQIEPPVPAPPPTPPERL